LGHKTIETRHWYTDYRGPLAIHAAKRNPEMPGMRFRWALEKCGLVFEDFYRSLPRGAIVAYCELLNCIRMDNSNIALVSKTNRAFGNYAPGRFMWTLGRIRALHDPIPFRGSQGFFYFDAPFYGRDALGVPVQVAMPRLLT
jgi:hypothetical protein